MGSYTRTKSFVEEHHISNFDAGAFFTLHDFDGSGDWTADEVLRTYGLEDESANNISVEKKKDAVKQILKLIDYDNDGRISRVEWNRFNAENGKLPDFGVCRSGTVNRRNCHIGSVVR